MLILESVPTGSKHKALIHKHLYGCLGEFNKNDKYPHPPNLMQQYIGPLYIHSWYGSDSRWKCISDTQKYIVRSQHTEKKCTPHSDICGR